MDSQRSEDVLAEPKLHPAPASDQMPPSSKAFDDSSLVNGNDNATAFATNISSSSAPAFDNTSTSTPQVDVNTITPAVNGASHHEDLVNGTQATTSPPTTFSSAPKPLSPPTQPEEIKPISDSLPAPPVPPNPSSAFEFPPSEVLPTETHSELSQPSTTELPVSAEPTGTISEAVASAAAQTSTTQPLPLETLPLTPSQPLKPEISGLRQSGVPVSLEEAKDIREEKHQADLAVDQELAEGLAADTTEPIVRSLPLQSKEEPQPSESAVDDVMDVTTEADIAQAEPMTDLAQPPQSSWTEEVNAESLSEPATASAPSISEPQVDQEMLDATIKVSRPREEDTQEDEPAAKRSKTGEAVASPSEFKVPELPQPRATENGTMVDSIDDGAPKMLTAPQEKFLVKTIQTMKRNKDSLSFLNPVDPVALGIPTYFDSIKNPMDLGTIEKKLKTNVYKSVEEVVADVDLIVSNTVTFNGLEHVVTKSGQAMRARFGEHLAKLPPTDVVVAEKKAPKVTTAPTAKATSSRRESRSAAPNPKSPTATAASPSAQQTFALNPDGVPLIRRDSMASDGRPKREIHPPKRGLDYGPSKPRKKKFVWELKFCQHVWDEMMKPKYAPIATPFYVPVDPVALNIPTYHNVIKKPMDLGTIGTKLKAGQYENAKEFEADVRQIFANCFKFNAKGDYIYNLGQSLETEFNREWERKKKWISDNAPNSNTQSQGTSPDPEEEDEDEGDDEDDEADDDDKGDQISILQKQIAAMSKKVEMIQKKKASPPAATKKSKNKPIKKEKKTPAPAPASKKKGSGKAGKAERVPIVTYDQKKLISDRINDLSETKMGQALRIIRDNVPHLKDVNEEEIELDIDELPNDVLYRLLQFVRTGTNTILHDTAEDDGARRRAALANAGPQKPKKNKPMGKHEQESQISAIQAKLAKFENGGGADDDTMRSIEQGVSSSDDDGSDESEEE